MTPDGPRERDVKLGLANDRMVEVLSGLEEGDKLIENPKVLLGETAKTREPVSEKKAGDKKGGKGKGGPPKA